LGLELLVLSLVLGNDPKPWHVFQDDHLSTTTIVAAMQKRIAQAAALLGGALRRPW